MRPKSTSHRLAVLSAVLALTMALSAPSVLAQDKTHRMPDRSQLGATDDIAFITQLGLIEGHIIVGCELYQQGEVSAGLSHVQHPVLEIYKVLEPELARQGLPGFLGRVEKLDQAMQANVPPGEMEALRNAVLRDIHALQAQRTDTARLRGAVSALAQIVGLEYGEGVIDGRVVEDYDYQDSWGFKRVVHRLVQVIGTRDQGAHAGDIKRANDALARLDAFWPDVVGNKKIVAPVGEMQGHIDDITAAMDNIK